MLTLIYKWQLTILLQFGTKMFITKMLEDYMKMGKMVAKQLTEHQDII